MPPGSPAAEPLAACEALFAITSQLDAATDYFNDYIFVLESLEGAFPGAILVDPRDGARQLNWCPGETYIPHAADHVDFIGASV